VGSLASGESAVFLIEGIEDEPSVFFANPADEMDLSLSILPGELAAGDVVGAAPIAEAAFGPAGMPEVMVFVPDADGRYTLAVTAVSGTSGDFAAYHLATVPTTADALLRQTVAVSPGQVGEHSLAGSGSNLQLVLVQPHDSSDVAVEVVEGSLSIVAGDFSGPGEVEVVFFYANERRTYTVRVTPANNRGSSYTITVLAME
jgi:hypothetical protein